MRRSLDVTLPGSCFAPLLGSDGAVVVMAVVNEKTFCPNFVFALMYFKSKLQWKEHVRYPK